MAPERYLEFRQIGRLVRVTAIDPATGTEATIQGPASAGQAALGAVAMKKLDYMVKLPKDRIK